MFWILSYVLYNEWFSSGRSSEDFEKGIWNVLFCSGFFLDYLKCLRILLFKWVSFIVSAVVRSPIGGDLIAEQCRIMCEEQKIEIVPAYKIASKVDWFLLLHLFLFSNGLMNLSSATYANERRDKVEYSRRLHFAQLITESWKKFIA